MAASTNQLFQKDARWGTDVSRCTGLMRTLLREVLRSRGKCASVPLLVACLFLAHTGAWAVIVEAKNVQVLIPSADFVTPAARLSIESVSKEEKRVGFFRVRVLLTEVAKGVRLEVYPPGDGTNWHNGFAFRPSMSTRNSTMEWRDVSICISSNSSPRLQVGRLEPPDARHPQECLLENVTFQSASGEVRASRARLLLRGPSATVVVETSDSGGVWNLFTGNPVSQSATLNQKHSK
jgi:hypothetical protein